MARDYNARKHISTQLEIYNDQRLTEVLMRAFDNICESKEPDGCFSTSAALHVVLRSLGYDPKICYGLCVTPAGHEIYHAWIELDKKVIDLAIYGNSHFSPYWFEGPIGPVVFDEYENTAVKYGDHIFDEDWDECMIAQAVKLGSVANYIANAPHVRHPSGNGMWRLIFAILDESYSPEHRSYLQQFVSEEAL